jgi:hypothetical protein
VVLYLKHLISIWIAVNCIMDLIKTFTFQNEGIKGTRSKEKIDVNENGCSLQKLSSFDGD